MWSGFGTYVACRGTSAVPLTTAGGATYGSLALGAMSVVGVYAPGSYDPATAGNSTSVLVQQFSIVPAPGALALLGVAGIIGGRRRRA